LIPRKYGLRRIVTGGMRSLRAALVAPNGQHGWTNLEPDHVEIIARTMRTSARSRSIGGKQPGHQHAPKTISCLLGHALHLVPELLAIGDMRSVLNLLLAHLFGPTG
jgi:hypothetical protein